MKNTRFNQNQDDIFATPHARIEAFSFNEHVAGVFNDMIDRSVPGYRTVIALSALLAADYAQPHSNCYDLGCSLGATTLAMRHRIRDTTCRIIAVDSAPAMLERFRHLLEQDGGLIPVELVLDDIVRVPVTRACVVVLNFTLQFLNQDQRLPLLKRIYQGLNPGGALIISEKTLDLDQTRQQQLEAWHIAFKRANGYSDLEISQKRTALENVLIPDTPATHLQRLRVVGFKAPQQWFQCFNFSSFIAIK